jgi:hypothetical protein
MSGLIFKYLLRKNMPIHIREIVIKATISDQNKGGKGVSNEESNDKSVIIQACVEQVMDILREKSAR